LIRSMTGFGSAHDVVEGVDYVVEVRSVNHRFFKAAIKLPEILAAAENEVERLLRGSIQRGSVTARVRMKLPDEQAAYRVNTKALQSYLDQLKMLETEADPTMHIDLGAIMQLPGVCEPPDAEDICQATHDGLMGLIGQAVDALVEMRTQEGGAIRSELMGLCDLVREGLEVVKSRAPKVVEDYRARLAVRVAELLHEGRAKIDEDVLAREVAIFAERCDVAEEVARLTGHVDQFRKAAAAPEATGRKLDFLAQEMLREANTIASKANDAEMAHQVVAMKTAIDRIKEQVANVE